MLSVYIDSIVLVLPMVFIVSYGIAKSIREITRGIAMYHYLQLMNWSKIEWILCTIKKVFKRSPTDESKKQKTKNRKQKKKTGKELLKCVSGMFDWEKGSTKPSNNNKKDQLFLKLFEVYYTR